MKIFAISGSVRGKSSNTAMLRALKKAAAPEHDISICESIGLLPIFSPDKEGEATPQIVSQFAQNIDEADGIIIASPEYVRSIPGALKNAIDWLVSREELINKPIALVHASQRGDDMLLELRKVLSTVSERFTGEVFLRFGLIGLSTQEISESLSTPDSLKKYRRFISDFSQFANQTKV